MATKLNVEETLAQARDYFMKGDYDSASFYYKKLKRREIYSEEVSFGITVGTAVKMTKNKIEAQLWAVMAAYDRLVNVSDTYDFTKEDDQKVFAAALKSIAYLCVVMRQIIRKEDERLEDNDSLEWTNAQSKWYDRTQELHSLEAFMVYHVLDMFWVKLRDKMTGEIGTEELKVLTKVALNFSSKAVYGDIRSRFSEDQILAVKERIKTYMKVRCPDWKLPQDPDGSRVKKVAASPEGTESEPEENVDDEEEEKIEIDRRNSLNQENTDAKKEIEKKRLDRARLNYVLLHTTHIELFMIVVILLGWTGLPPLYLKAYRGDTVAFLFLYYFILIVAKSPVIPVLVEACMILLVLYMVLTGATIKNRIIWLPKENEQ